MNIFVGCGSRIPKNEEYCSLAEKIGRAIVEKKDNFVFANGGKFIFDHFNSNYK